MAEPTKTDPQHKTVSGSNSEKSPKSILDQIRENMQAASPLLKKTDDEDDDGPGLDIGSGGMSISALKRDIYRKAERARQQKEQEEEQKMLLWVQQQQAEQLWQEHCRQHAEITSLTGEEQKARRLAYLKLEWEALRRKERDRGMDMDR